MRTTLRATTTSTTTAPSAAMAGTTGNPDMALIGELLEEITRHPPAIHARKLLVEHYMSVGWLEAALDNAKDLDNLNPGDTEVAHFLSVLQKKPEPPAPQEKKKIKTPSILSTPSVASSKKTTKRVWDVKTARYITVQEAPQPQAVKIEASTPNPISDFETEKQDFTQGYEALRTKAKYVISNLLQLQSLQRKVGLPPSKHTGKIQAIAEGQRRTVTDSAAQPASARSVARTIRDRPEEGTALALADLEDTMNRILQSNSEPKKVDVDQLRDGLIKRKRAVESALPDGLRLHCEIAFMHIEHENLSRNYANTETMLGDEVKDIARENFYVTEDNYAWDMEELVQAITVGKGIMRNPLSKEMFTPSDVKGILLHPLGKPLGALAVEQHEMSKGVRSRTIEEMEKLAKILLEDQSADTLPSRKAVDEFLAYIATLPEMEQKAIEHLKCPAKDSHTGRAYDFSIGEAVRDAKGNRVCFHKTGDFISQAAIHLRQNRGVAPDPGNCSTM